MQGSSVGWVERSETHHLRDRGDGFRCALPILRTTSCEETTQLRRNANRVAFVVCRDVSGALEFNARRVRQDRGESIESGGEIAWLRSPPSSSVSVLKLLKRSRSPAFSAISSMS
jgi:hypothetical protein